MMSPPCWHGDHSVRVWPKTGRCKKDLAVILLQRTSINIDKMILAGLPCLPPAGQPVVPHMNGRASPSEIRLAPTSRPCTVSSAQRRPKLHKLVPSARARQVHGARARTRPPRLATQADLSRPVGIKTGTRSAHSVQIPRKSDKGCHCRPSRESSRRVAAVLIGVLV